MKHLTAFLLAVFVGFSSFLPAFAAKLNLMDFSSLGIAAMEANTAKNAPVQDGTVFSDEYSSLHISDGKSGLAIASSDGKLSAKSAADLNLRQETFLSVDQNYIYCAIRLDIGSDTVGGVYKKNLGYVYPLTVSVSISPGEHPANRCSFWSNTYYFSAENAKCVGVSGERIARSVAEETVFSLRISNISSIYQENGYLDPSGVKWDADHYRDRAAFSIVKGAKTAAVTAEILIPIGDVLLSVPERERRDIAEKWQMQKDPICGSFFSQSGVFSNGDQVILGLPTSKPYPFSEEWGSFKEYIKENYETPKSGAFVPDYLPIPLWFFEKESFSSDLSGNGDGADQNKEFSDAQRQDPNTSAESTSSGKTGLKKTTSTSAFTVPNPNEELLFNESEDHGEDESVFGSLPGEGDVLPEDTEIVYLSQSEKASAKNKGSLLGSALTFSAGVFLFAAMIVLVFFVRVRKEPQEQEMNQQKKVKKTKKG